MKRQGFTLAETLFAMAILAFTILSIFGMMPGALTNLQASEHREAEARIYQTLAAEYGSKPWKELRNFAPTDLLYFDATGLPLERQEDNAVFIARIEPETASMTLPGEGTQSPFLRRLRIFISDRVHEPGVLNSTRRNDNKRREFGLIVVNQEPEK